MKAFPHQQPRPCSLCLSAAAACLLLVGSVRAQTPQIDQSFFVSQIGITLYSNQSWGQTFTMAQSGQMTQLDLPIWRYSANVVAPLRVELCSLTGSGLPDLSPSGVVFDTTIDASQVPVGLYGGFDLSLSLNGGIPAQAGARYAILCSASDWYQWTTARSDLYTGGYALWNPWANTSWQTQSGYDSGFRTWVVVPEPTGLLPLGLAVLSFCLRKKSVG